MNLFTVTYTTANGGAQATFVRAGEAIACANMICRANGAAAMFQTGDRLGIRSPRTNSEGYYPKGQQWSVEISKAKE